MPLGQSQPHAELDWSPGWLMRCALSSFCLAFGLESSLLAVSSLGEEWSMVLVLPVIDA